MLSLSSNHVLDVASLRKVLLYLFEVRKDVLQPKLNRLFKQEMASYSLWCSHPYFLSTFSSFSERFRFQHSSHYAPLLQDLNWWIKWYTGSEEKGLEDLTLLELKDLVLRVYENNRHWTERSNDYSTLT